MFTSLDSLLSHIKNTVPHSESVYEICYQPVLDGLTFTWFGTTFFVKNTCEVFEVRGKTLYVTGNSMLLESLISYDGSREQKALEDLSSALDRVEGLLVDRRTSDEGLHFLQKGRAILSKLAAQPVAGE